MKNVPTHRLACLLRPGLLALAFAALMAACSMEGGLDGPSPAQQRSTLQRITDPSVPPADLAELVANNTAFGLDLYQEVGAGAQDNTFLSPYSISLALAMTYAGAGGNTALEMADTLHLTLPPERLHPAFDALDLALASRGQGAQGADGKGFRLNIVNATWGQQGHTFLMPFLDVLAASYGAGMFNLDFATDPEGSRQTINDWVENQTEGRIKDLIPQGTIDSLTRLVLTNAIYFNAAWANPFDESSTTDGAFHRLDGSSVTAALMHQDAFLGVAQLDGLQAVELPYDGDELSMVVILPDEGRFQEIESGLDSASLARVLGAIQTADVALTLPRFTYTSSFQLKAALTDLGMADAFRSGVADFSGMDGTRDLYIGAVIHKAFIKVNEAGTEAAAATAVIMEGGLSVEAPIPVTVDRPFLFLIRDRITGAVLFLGRVTDPTV